MTESWCKYWEEVLQTTFTLANDLTFAASTFVAKLDSTTTKPKQMIAFFMMIVIFDYWLMIKFLFKSKVFLIMCITWYYLLTNN